MAEDTDKKPVVEGSADTAGTSGGAAKVGDGGKIPKRRKLSLGLLFVPLRRIRNKKKTFAYIILAAIIIGGGWAVIKKEFHIGDKVYARAAGHKVYKQEVKDLIGNTQGVSDHDAATVLADKYLTEALAKDQGVTVTDQDIRNQYGGKVNLKDQQKNYAYAYQQAVNSAYFNKLQAKYNGVYRGDILVAQFSRYIPASPVSAAYKKAIPEMGDPKAIAADKQYADDFINKLYNQLQDHKITWKQAFHMEQTDPRLGVKAYPSLSHSGPFDTSKNPVTLFDAPAAQQKISGLKAGETTKPFVVSVYNQDTKKSFDSYYLVVHMSSTYGGHASGSFQQYLVDSKKRLDYQVNV